MQLADAAEAIAIDAGPQIYFVYHEGMERGDVPEDVTHVRVHSSVKAIIRTTHSIIGRNWQLVTVILNDGLEEIEIGGGAFVLCASLGRIVIPPPCRQGDR